MENPVRLIGEVPSRRDFLHSAAALFLGVGLAGSTRGASAGEPEWRVGLGRMCTTPPQPLWLHGYAGKPRFRPFEGKLNELYAKAMALETAGGQRGVLITIDQCVIRGREAQAIFARLEEKTGLDRRQIILNFSHTHSGPIIGASDLDRYPMSAEERQATVAYTERLQNLLVEVVRAAVADLKPARLSWGKGKCGFVRNRRQYNADGTYRGMGPNPNRYVDDVVPVLRVDGPDGALRAVVFGCACHAVTLDAANLKLSGDYPSFAQEHIERQYPGVQAMFVQGCGADANSNPRGGPNQEQYVRQQGQSLGTEVCRVVQEKEKLSPVGGPLRIAWAETDLPLQAPPSREKLKQMGDPMAHNAQRILAALARNESLPTHHRVPLAVWQWGDDLTLAAIAGEVVSAYVPMFQKALGPERLWIAGYSNEVDGYLPDAVIVAEGGYEARGLVADIGFFSAEAQDVVVSTVARLAREAGR